MLEHQIRLAMHQGRDVQPLIDASMGDAGLQNLARRAAGLQDRDLATAEGAAAALMNDDAIQ